MSAVSRSRVPTVAGALNRNPPQPGSAPAVVPPPAPGQAQGQAEDVPVTEVPPPAVEPLSFGWQGPSRAKVGDKVTLVVNTSSGIGVKSLGLLIGYDPTVLKAVEVAEGSLLKQADPAASFSSTIDQGSGQIVVDLGSQAGTGGSKGSVATVTFEVTGVAVESAVTISRIAPAGANGEAVSFVTPAAFKLGLVQ
jgi:hypothetical protein